MSVPLMRKVYGTLPAPIQKPLSAMKRSLEASARKRRLKPIQIESCLLGGDNGISAASFARMVGDIKRASRPIAQWPHVKLLRQFDEIGEQLWEPAIFEQTEYYQNAAINIEMCSRYFDAIRPAEIQAGAQRFVNLYLGASQDSSLQTGQSTAEEEIAVRPIKYSSCYEVLDGHHRLALNYVKGVKEAACFVISPAVTTPVQDLLLDVSWLKGRKELYQPVDSPEVKDWVLVRRCSDRLEKMKRFLDSEAVKSESTTYLDVACSYGWFVSEMSKAGFDAKGVERDPTAIAVGRTMYGLPDDRVSRADCVTFLHGLQEKKAQFEITSCFSLVHHYILNEQNATAEELLALLDSVTGKIMFFDMGESHEEFFSGGKYSGWNPDSIEEWLKKNTTFTRIVRLGIDEDAIPPFQESYRRTLFACLR